MPTNSSSHSRRKTDPKRPSPVDGRRKPAPADMPALLPCTLSNLLRHAVRESIRNGRSVSSLARDIYGNSKHCAYVRRFLDNGGSLMRVSTAERIVNALGLSLTVWKL